jgi:hypothetical protein
MVAHTATPDFPALGLVRLEALACGEAPVVRRRTLPDVRHLHRQRLEFGRLVLPPPDVDA